MTIRVHYYEDRDGLSVCKNCGMVENKDRVGPSWCSGKLPSIGLRVPETGLSVERGAVLSVTDEAVLALRAELAKVERERDRYREMLRDSDAEKREHVESILATADALKGPPPAGCVNGGGDIVEAATALRAAHTETLARLAAHERVVEAVREFRRWDAILALTVGEGRDAEDAQDDLRAIDAALAALDGGELPQ